MNHSNHLFAEFDTVSFEEWIDKVVIDLKGKSIENFNHQIADKIIVSPFHHSDHQSGNTNPLVMERAQNDWLIGEDVPTTNDLKRMNHEALEGLENGVQAPCFTLPKFMDKEHLRRLLNKIEPAYISTHFIVNDSRQALSVLKDFVELAAKKTGEAKNFSGSISTRDQKYDGDLINWCSVELPNFKCWHLQSMAIDPVASLVELMEAGIAELTSAKTPKQGQKLVTAVQFNIQIGYDYFTEIARLRALRMLWANILQSFGLDHQLLPSVTVRFRLDSQTNDPNQNLIQATTMATSAILGGADILTILPADQEQSDQPDFYRRIARNVQHLLKMEAYLDRVIDPAAGSYYVEHLTKAFCNRVWKKLGR